jgi:hypothetical protein
MSRSFDPSQQAAVSVALFAVLHMRFPWEGTAVELRELLSHYITNAPPARALEGCSWSSRRDSTGRGIDLGRINGPVRRTWALRLVRDPRSDLPPG